ncbi:MAG: hypothetical protein PHS77_07220 [Gallionellaceae bacterium]|nr:hypothetical protein [Gallionellaceae bacterium]
MKAWFATRLPARLWELDELAVRLVLELALPSVEAHRLARLHGLTSLKAEADEVRRALLPYCCERGDLADEIHRQLDRIHVVWVGRFGKVSSEQALLAMWRAAVERGELSSALWGALTCRLANRKIRAEICREAQAGSGSGWRPAGPLAQLPADEGMPGDDPVLSMPVAESSAPFANVELLAGALENLAGAFGDEGDARDRHAAAAFLFGCLARDAGLGAPLCRACGQCSDWLAGQGCQAGMPGFIPEMGTRHGAIHANV